MRSGRGIGNLRAWNIALRTAHMAAGGVLFGGHVFDIGTERLADWLLLTLATGVLLVLLEIRHGRRWAVEGRGVLVLAKILILCALPWLWPQRVPLLFVVIVIGSAGSHMPKRLRHYSLLERRYINPDDEEPAGRQSPPTAS